MTRFFLTRRVRSQQKAVNSSVFVSFRLLVFFCPLSPCTLTLTSSLFSTAIFLFSFLISSAFIVVFLFILFSPQFPIFLWSPSLPHALHFRLYIQVSPVLLILFTFLFSLESFSSPFFPLPLHLLILFFLSLLSVTTTTTVLAAR